MAAQLNWLAIPSQAFFEALPDPAIMVGIDGTVLAGNQCACNLFEFDAPFPAIAVDKLLTQPERKRLQVMSWLRKWADTPTAPELDYVYLTIQTSAGEPKQLSTRVSRLQMPQLASRSSTNVYLVTMHDIGPWEQRLRREQRAHKMASHVLAQCADAVLVVNNQYHISFANRSAEALFIYPPNGLNGLALATLLPERFRNQHPKWMANFAEEPQVSRYMDQRSPVLALTSRGTEVAVEATITRIRLAGELSFSVHMRQILAACPP